MDIILNQSICNSKYFFFTKQNSRVRCSCDTDGGCWLETVSQWSHPTPGGEDGCPWNCRNTVQERVSVTLCFVYSYVWLMVFQFTAAGVRGQRQTMAALIPSSASRRMRELREPQTWELCQITGMDLEVCLLPSISMWWGGWFPIKTANFPDGQACSLF